MKKGESSLKQDRTSRDPCPGTDCTPRHYTGARENLMLAFLSLGLSWLKRLLLSQIVKLLNSVLGARLSAGPLDIPH